MRAAAAMAEAKFLVFVVLSNQVEVAILKRRSDIVASLCLAAATAQPIHACVLVYVLTSGPEGELNALNAVIMRYYLNDVMNQIQVSKLYDDSTKKSGVHFGGRNLFHTVTIGTADRKHCEGTIENIRL